MNGMGLENPRGLFYPYIPMWCIPAHVVHPLSVPLQASVAGFYDLDGYRSVSRMEITTTVTVITA